MCVWAAPSAYELSPVTPVWLPYRLAGRVWVGGSIRKGGPVKVLSGLPEDTPEAPEIPQASAGKVSGRCGKVLRRVERTGLRPVRQPGSKPAS